MQILRDSVARFHVMVAAAGVLYASVASFAALAAVDPGAAVAPRMEFTPPRAGSYVLQKIQLIADATLLDPAGKPTRLSIATTGRITLLTFFYTYCADPLGCPFAYHTLTELRPGGGEDTRLAKRLRFLKVSLDPTTVPPEAIGRYKEMVIAESTMEWNCRT